MSVLPEKANINALKRLINRFQEVCGTVSAPEPSRKIKCRFKGGQADKHMVAFFSVKVAATQSVAFNRWSKAHIFVYYM